MSSFLNKKFSLILIILATLFIAASISCVSSTWTLEAEVEGSPISTNWTTNPQVTIKGNITNVTSTAPTTPEFNISGTVYLNYSYDGINFNKTYDTWVFAHQDNLSQYNFSFKFNVQELDYLGPIHFLVYYENDTPVVTATERDEWVSANIAGELVNETLVGNYLRVIDDTLKLEILNTNVLKVGQQGNFTAYVYGIMWNDTSQRNVPLPYVNVTVNVTGLPFTTVNTGPNADNCTFFVPILRSTSIRIDVGSNLAVTDAYVDWNGNGVPYSSLYVSNVFGKTIPVLPGLVNADIWWDTGDLGYLVGNSSILYWNITGNGSLVGTDILAWVVLYDYENPNQILRRFQVPLYNPALTVTGVDADGFINLTPFTKAHPRLIGRLVIDGRDLANNLARVYDYSVHEAETFVYTADAKPVRLNQSDIQRQLNNLRVGQLTGIEIWVYDRLNPTSFVDSGLVNVTWDGKYSFIVPVVGGLANFTHVFARANSSRLLEIRYMHDPSLGYDQSAFYKFAPVAVGRANTTITLSQTLNNASAYLGENVTITALIDKFVAASDVAPKFITLKFLSGGSEVHRVEVPIIPDPEYRLNDQVVAANTAIAKYEHTYTKVHSDLRITAEVTDGLKNYNTATGTLTVVVTNPI